MTQDTEPKRYTATVEEDKGTGDLYFLFPPDLLEQVGWSEGDIINWEDNRDGSWSLTKKSV